MNDQSEQVEIRPTFETRESFFVVGCVGEFQPGATGDIGQLWDRFGPRIDEIADRVGSATYGMCLLPEEGPRDPGRFTYVAAVQTASLAHIPGGMTGVEIPTREYAVFAYDGGIGPELPKTMQFIFGDWLPDSVFEIDGADFEYYDDRFDPQTGTGTFFIYVPIKRKA